MKNLQQIIDRYNGKIDRKSVIGYLLWGGKAWYKINSNKPIQLNSNFNGFILNKKGQVQEYKMGKIKTIKKWGEKLDKYYPHPYFPDKKIKHFEVIRIIPGFFVGDKVRCWAMFELLEFPEFYKPIY